MEPLVKERYKELMQQLQRSIKGLEEAVEFSKTVVDDESVLHNIGQYGEIVQTLKDVKRDLDQAIEDEDLENFSQLIVKTHALSEMIATDTKDIIRRKVSKVSEEELN